MPPENPLSEKITSVDEFEAAIEQVLAAAVTNGVDPRGAWTFHTDTVATDWEVIIMELKNTTS